MHITKVSKETNQQTCHTVNAQILNAFARSIELPKKFQIYIFSVSIESEGKLWGYLVLIFIYAFFS